MSDHAETVRAALTFMRDCGDRPGMHEAGEKALAAFDLLEAELAEWVDRSSGWKHTADRRQERIDALVAENAQATSSLVRERYRMHEQRLRAETAEAERDEARAALAETEREAEEQVSEPLRTPEQMEWIRARYKPDGLERLARADSEYADAHGYYLPDVAALAYAEWERAEAAEAELLEYTTDIGYAAGYEAGKGTASAQAASLREALADIGSFAASHSGRDGQDVLLAAVYRIAEEAEQALAGGGRTRGQDSGGDGLGAFAVAETDEPYDHATPTRFSLDDCKAAVSKRATLVLTGMVVAAAESHTGPYVKFQPDARFGFGDFRFVIDLDALALITEAALKRPNQEGFVTLTCICPGPCVIPGHFERSAAAQVREGETRAKADG